MPGKKVASYQQEDGLKTRRKLPEVDLSVGSAPSVAALRFAGTISGTDYKIVVDDKGMLDTCCYFDHLTPNPQTLRRMVELLDVVCRM